jgi:zinc transport system ATP-binding protein
MKREILLECRKAALGYENQRVLQQLDFQVESGDYIGILGENGSGKSTLMKGLLGFLKPLEGEIIRADHLMQGCIGYLPQQTEAQRDFPATVQEVVLSGFLSAGKHRFFYTKEEKKQALSNMEKVQVEKLKRRSYRELSGGQQQRVLLARALCAAQGPVGKGETAGAGSYRLLVLDEPVTGLDPAAAAELYRILGTLNKQEKVTILMVSHDVENVLDQAGKILHLGNQKSFFGTVNAYRHSDISRYLKGGA